MNDTKFKRLEEMSEAEVKHLEEIEENRLEDMSANLVLSNAKERDEAQDSPSPVKYVPSTHRDIFTTKVRQRCGLELNEEQADGIATAYEEMQLENAQIAVEQGFGLAAFFPIDQRVQIKKSVRLRIEQLILMLGDAFVERQDIPSHIEHSSVNRETRRAAHAVHTHFTGDVDGSRCDGVTALCELMDCFPVLPERARIPGACPDSWDPDAMWQWAKKRSSSERDSVHFCLSVWNAKGGWGRFDLVNAWANWDFKHRGVVQGWLDRPWWP